jgi:hypothetical protein
MSKSGTKSKKLPPGVVFDNGRYQVSIKLLSTPRRFYPIENTTARIRRDPLWLGLALSVFAAMTTFIYGDLLLANEILILWCVAGASLLAGLGTAILHIDAIGHRNAMVFGSLRTVRKIFAMRDARAKVESHNITLFEEKNSSE